MPEDASCSRAKSRVARALLKKRGLVRDGASLPAGCPLRSERDVFADQEAHKRPVRSSEPRGTHRGRRATSTRGLLAILSPASGRAGGRAPCGCG